VISRRPSIDDIRGFFGQTDDWLFFGGHFVDLPRPQLYNEREDCRVEFARENVRVQVGAETTELVKGRDFRQHERVKCVFWGGCNVSTSEDTVNTLRGLFGARHLMVGWKGKTGWEVLFSLMGGFGNVPPHASRDFFDRIRGGDTDLEAVRLAWMRTALDTDWRNYNINNRLSLIEPNGQEWIIRDGAIVRGRRF